MARPAPAARFLRLCRHQQQRSYSAPGDGQIPANKQKYVPTTGTYPQGFSVGTAHAGVKPLNTRFDDITLYSSNRPCAAAAVFTQNRFQAAPVTVSREILQKRSGAGIRGVLVNSGCANAVTGKGGLDDAREMAKVADEALPKAPHGGQKATDQGVESTIVMSTGVIGQRLPMQRILPAIPRATTTLGSDHDHHLAGARAICTTDTFPKLISHAFTLPSHPRTIFHLSGTAKGAGMIHPNMATLLSIMLTDAPVSPSALQEILIRAIARSFNSISIDGDTSTNDTVALLANGAAASSSPLYKGSAAGVVTDADSEDGRALQDAVTATATGLAQLVVRDGEGATKFVTIRVRGGQERWVRHRVARTVARSPLVKTALYGRDANWGRVLCAVGYADGLPEGSVRPEAVGVSFVGTGKEKGELRLLVDGEPAPEGVDEDAADKILAEEDLEILIRLDGKGKEDGADDIVFWTCDFSHEYVTINGDYRT